MPTEREFPECGGGGGNLYIHLHANALANRSSARARDAAYEEPVYAVKLLLRRTEFILVTQFRLFANEFVWVHLA